MSPLLLRAIPRKGRVATAIWWGVPVLALLALAWSWRVGLARTPPHSIASSAAAAPGTASLRSAPARPVAPARPASSAAAALDAGVLRVCADPNNLPFSDRQGRGFENRIAELIASDLHERVQFFWWAQRRGFVRHTLKAHACDVVIGIGTGDDMLLTSAPYYRSTYVFVQRRGSEPIRSFDDPRLRGMRIGVHVIGDDGNALPPALALTRRGLLRNIRGYSIYGNYAQPAPPARLIEAVAHRDVDLAVAWGPLAGYFARREAVPLTVTPVATPMAIPGVPFTYAISLGVRRGDTARLARLQDVLRRHAPQLRAILRSYGVPLVADRSTLIAANSGEGR